MVCREVWSAGGSAVGTATVTALAFVGGLVVTLAASEVFARGLTRLGTKLHFSEGLIGLLAAAGADSPELSSAVAALVAGAGSVGVGVIVGSNLFNLAALLGLSALVARGVAIRRGPLLLDATVGLAIIVVAAGMAAGVLPPAASLATVLPVWAVYVFLLAVPRASLRAAAALIRAVPRDFFEVSYEVSHDRPAIRHQSWLPVFAIPLALAGVVGGSFLMVREALAANEWLHLSAAVLGGVVLAVLTSLPNLYVALHFARNYRGTALFSSAMNSNSINLIGGLVVPAVLIGATAARGSLAYFTWLIDLTLLAVLAPLVRGSLSRTVGAVIIAVYLVFVMLRVAGV